MSASSDDDQKAVDRAFEELVAGYHLTAEGHEIQPKVKVEPEPPAEPAVDASWADEHPLFVFEPRPAEPAPEPRPAPEPEERYVPEPPPPLPRPAFPVLLAWIGIAWAAAVVLLAAFGVRLPSWTGWIALLGFVGGFAVLVFRLPRDRPPGSGDGAVL